MKNILSPRGRRTRGLASKSRHAGLTLVELLVTLAVLGIVSAIAAPMVGNVIYKAQVDAFSAELLATGRTLTSHVAHSGGYATITNPGRFEGKKGLLDIFSEAPTPTVIPIGPGLNATVEPSRDIRYIFFGNAETDPQTWCMTGWINDNNFELRQNDAAAVEVLGTRVCGIKDLDSDGKLDSKEVPYKWNGKTGSEWGMIPISEQLEAYINDNEGVGGPTFDFSDPDGDGVPATIEGICTTDPSNAACGLAAGPIKAPSAPEITSITQTTLTAAAIQLVKPTDIDGNGDADASQTPAPAGIIVKEYAVTCIPTDSALPNVIARSNGTTLDASVAFVIEGMVETTSKSNPTTYKCKVQASTSATPETSGWSNEVTITLDGLPTAAPAAPTGLGESGRIDLQWSAIAADDMGGVGALTQYEIWYSEFANFPASQYFTKTVTGTEVATTLTNGLENGKGYFVKIRAVNKYGAGPWSTNSAEIMTATEPEAPTGLTATASTTQNGRIALTWTIESDGAMPITDYVIDYAFDAEFTDQTSVTVPVASIGGTAPSATYALTGLSNNKQYFVRVSAKNALGTSEKSESADATTAGAPEVVNTVDASNNLPNEIELKWARPAANGSTITGFIIQYSESSAFTTTLTKTITLAQVTVTGGLDTFRLASDDNGTTLTDGTIYYIRIIAVNGVGQGAVGPWDQGATQASPDEPAAPVIDGNGDINF